jgi:hypothetical protein
MNYRIIIITDSKKEDIDPFISMKIENKKLLIWNGYAEYDYNIDEIVSIKFEVIN